MNSKIFTEAMSKIDNKYVMSAKRFSTTEPVWRKKALKELRLYLLPS